MTPVADKRPTRILHVITGLDIGGAEISLHGLLASLDRSRFDASVVSLAGRGPIAERISSLGIPVHALDLRSSGVSPSRVRQVMRAVSSWSPALVQGWMYHGNLGALALSGFRRRRPPVLWNIRHSVDRLEQEKRSTRWVIRAGATLSRRPEGIIYNSRVSAKQHERLGYRHDRGVVIPNGFDTDRFQPSQQRRRQQRGTLGIADNQLVVGMVARYHPMKGHHNFVEAARRLHSVGSDAMFLLAGRGVTSANADLDTHIGTGSFRRRLRLLGEVGDIPSLMASLDLLVSASAYGEGFPNVVGEAMATAVPCVVTDVGDSAFLVGDNRCVVAPKDPDALSAAIASVLDLDENARTSISRQARDRVIRNFSTRKMTARYAAVYESVLKGWDVHGPSWPLLPDDVSPQL